MSNKTKWIIGIIILLIVGAVIADQIVGLSPSGSVLNAGLTKPRNLDLCDPACNDLESCVDGECVPVDNCLQDSDCPASTPHCNEEGVCE